MKKDLLEQVKEDLKKQEGREYSLIYEFMQLVPSKEIGNIINYNELNNELYIDSKEICNLNNISYIYEEDSKEDEYNSNVHVLFENFDTNAGVVFATRKLIFKYDCTAEGDDDWKYELEDWIENPTYREEVESEMIPLEPDDMPI